MDLTWNLLVLTQDFTTKTSATLQCHLRHELMVGLVGKPSFAVCSVCNNVFFMFFSTTRNRVGNVQTLHIEALNNLSTRSCSVYVEKYQFYYLQHRDHTHTLACHITKRTEHILEQNTLNLEQIT